MKITVEKAQQALAMGAKWLERPENATKGDLVMALMSAMDAVAILHLLNAKLVHNEDLEMEDEVGEHVEG